MNNYCRNCGEKLVDIDICKKCGTKVSEKRMGELDKKLAKKYIIIFFVMLVLIWVGSNCLKILLYPFFSSFATILVAVLPLVLLIFVIYAKKKLKYSKFFNILFWTFLLFLILLIIFIIFQILSCTYEI